MPDKNGERLVIVEEYFKKTGYNIEAAYQNFVADLGVLAFSESTYKTMLKRYKPIFDEVEKKYKSK